MQEPEQAPGGLVRDRGVGDEHQERVEAEEAQGPRIRPGDSLRAPAGGAPDHREDEDEPLGPEGRSARREVDQQPKVVVPGVEVPRGGPGPVQVEPVGPHRVHDAPRGGRGTRRRAAHDTSDRRERAPAARAGAATTLRIGGTALLRASGPRGGVNASASSMQPRARGAVSLVASISPAHAPARRAGAAPGARRYRQAASSAPKLKKTSGVSWMKYRL